MSRNKEILNEEPPGKGVMGISTAHLPVDGIKSKRKVGWWDRLSRPILYPAGGSICTRCLSIHLLIR